MKRSKMVAQRLAAMDGSAKRTDLETLSPRALVVRIDRLFVKCAQKFSMEISNEIKRCKEVLASCKA